MKKVYTYKYWFVLLFFISVHYNDYAQQNRYVSQDSLFAFTISDTFSVKEYDSFNLRITKSIGWASNVTAMPIKTYYNVRDYTKAINKYKNLKNFVNDFLNYEEILKVAGVIKTSVLDSLKEWKSSNNYNAAIGYYKEIYSHSNEDADTVFSNKSFFIELPKQNNIVVLIFCQTHPENSEDTKQIYNILNSIILLTE